MMQVLISWWGNLGSFVCWLYRRSGYQLYYKEFSESLCLFRCLPRALLQSHIAQTYYIPGVFVLRYRNADAILSYAPHFSRVLLWFWCWSLDLFFIIEQIFELCKLISSLITPRERFRMIYGDALRAERRRKEHCQPLLAVISVGRRSDIKRGPARGGYVHVFACRLPSAPFDKLASFEEISCFLWPESVDQWPFLGNMSQCMTLAVCVYGGEGLEREGEGGKGPRCIDRFVWPFLIHTHIRKIIS